MGISSLVDSALEIYPLSHGHGQRPFAFTSSFSAELRLSTILLALFLCVTALVGATIVKSHRGESNALNPAKPLTADTGPNRSHGQKSLLFIRARFPDDPNGALPTDSQLNNNAAFANRDFLAYSYGQFSLTWNVGPVVTLPCTTSAYQLVSGKTSAVLSHARLLALAEGYDSSQYDVCIVYIPRFYGIFTVSWPTGKTRSGWNQPIFSPIHTVLRGSSRVSICAWPIELMGG